jgi:hypothetical protein
MNTRPITIALAGLILLFGANAADAGTATGLQTTESPAHTFEPPTDAELDRLGMEKLAEMTAMSRHDEICPDAPREWSAAFIVLLMKTPPSEEEVETQERNTLALRNRIGKTKWCQLYSIEMQEAYLIFQMLMQHKSP